MPETALSPRIRNLLIHDNPTGLSLPPLRLESQMTRQTRVSRPGTGSMPPPHTFSPRSLNGDVPGSPVSIASTSLRPSTSPSTVTISSTSAKDGPPAANGRTSNISSLLNPSDSSPITASSSSFPEPTHQVRPETSPGRNSSVSYPRRAPPATFPLADVSQSAYFDERPHGPLTPGPDVPYYARHPSYPDQVHDYSYHHADRPVLFRRHSSHPHERYPHCPPYHPYAHRHSTPHAPVPTVMISAPPPVPGHQSRPMTAYHYSSRNENEASLNTGARAPISRTTKACNNCRGRKVRCDAGAATGGTAGEAPCTRCNESGLECIYTSVQKKRGPCPGTARPTTGVSKTPRGSISKQTLFQSELKSKKRLSSSSSYGGGPYGLQAPMSPVSSHRSSVASVQTSMEIVTPEEAGWTHTAPGHGFPFPQSHNGGGGPVSPGYDWSAANAGVGKLAAPQGWSVGPRGSYSHHAPWEERQWPIEGGTMRGST